MTTRVPDSLERLAPADLIGVVRDLIGEVGRLRAENEKLGGTLAKLKVEYQAVQPGNVLARSSAASYLRPTSVASP
jgi:hypothetical protein